MPFSRVGILNLGTVTFPFLNRFQGPLKRLDFNNFEKSFTSLSVFKRPKSYHIVERVAPIVSKPMIILGLAFCRHPKL